VQKYSCYHVSSDHESGEHTTSSFLSSDEEVTTAVVVSVNGLFVDTRVRVPGAVERHLEP